MEGMEYIDLRKAGREGLKEKIEVFFLPPYAPEYNPAKRIKTGPGRSVLQACY